MLNHTSEAHVHDSGWSMGRRDERTGECRARGGWKREMGGREDGEEIISKWGRADGQDGERIIN